MNKHQQTVDVRAQRFNLGELDKTSGSSVTLSIVKSGKIEDCSSFCNGTHIVPPSSAFLPPFISVSSLSPTMMHVRGSTFSNLQASRKIC